MEWLEHKVSIKRKELVELRRFALSRNPAYLPLIRKISDEIYLCDYVLKQLYYARLRRVG
jgi:hypothetical protein